MLVIYKFITKMLVHRVHNILHDGLHPLQYGFVHRRQIYDNIANAMTTIEYAKYTEQDVLILQVDIAKAFGTLQWDFIAQTMNKIEFGPKLVQAIYWLYKESSTQCCLANHLSRPWTLGRSVTQGCPLSALLYAIATHPLLLYLDHLTSRGQLKGLPLPGAANFVAQAYANDSFFMPQNTTQELKTLMDALSLFGLAAGLDVNFEKSK